VIRVLTILLCLSCGRPVDRIEVPPHVQVNELAEFYATLLPTIQDADGYVNASDCDALLFNSLLSAAGAEITILLSMDWVSGQWYRTKYKNCYDEDKSASTISGDMLLGLMWHIWRAKDLTMAENLYQYGRKNTWVMGQGPISRTGMKPILVDTLAKIIRQMGGKNHPMLVPDIWPKVPPGFGRHLQTLHILLRGQIEGKLAKTAVDRIVYNYSQERGNILFQAAHRKWVDPSTRIDLSAYPLDRLPTSLDWCEQWPVQRAADSNGLNPCDEGKTHSGGEIGFIKMILEA